MHWAPELQGKGADSSGDELDEVAKAAAEFNTADFFESVMLPLLKFYSSKCVLRFESDKSNEEEVQPGTQDGN